MTNPADRDAEALDYVLRTLSEEERRRLDAEMERDPALRQAVRDWEERLAPLAENAPAIEPSPGLWAGIERALDRPASVPLDLSAIRRSRARWRGTALALGALAAALVAAIGIERHAGQGASRPLVAVVNRSGELPALIVRVDPAAGTVQVRSVATETPPAHSLELWFVPEGAAPRSLGLVRAGLVDMRGAGLAAGGTLAVSVEPAGGSPTGAPTGPVVYSGRLIPETP